MDCLFCKIINGEIPSKTLYEDDDVKVIMDINPDSNGHCLIIPKKHYITFEDLDDEILIIVNKTAKEIKKYIDKALNPDGYKITVNYGISQLIKHYHLHVIPVYKNNNLKDIEEIYQKIKDVM
ncbi:MAG: HIT domain-containing protein [Mollicutes bacterium]|jgi:histidine triad (HIT) family protein|nr:HIT domain-containing protein [Mollicutes bacterium]